MKKILTFFLIFFLCACNEEKIEVNYTYNIQSSEVDMSTYESMGNQEHCFKRITVDELYACYVTGSSGIFYLGYDTCPFCNRCIEYLNEVGMNMGVTIYYIDATNSENPVIGDNATIKELTNFLEPILDCDNNGKKVLMTPHVFTIINGQFYDSFVSLPYKKNGDLDFDKPPTDKQIKNIKNIYQRLFKPFVS